MYPNGQISTRRRLTIRCSFEGELYTALEAKFDLSKIHFHGNNKTKREIQYALESGVGYFVIDSLEELI